MPEQRLLPAATLRFGEPWRLGRNHSGIVSDHPDGWIKGADGIEARAHYGGNLVAESISSERATRAIECVNFCAGFWFPPGTAYPNGLVDLVDVTEQLHRRLWDDRGEPRGRYVGLPTSERPAAKAEYDLWSASYLLLRSLGRDV